ncbi:MAG: hypothetical protein ACE5GA_05920 [Candidatus Zixiibacteriota bacterium]
MLLDDYIVLYLVWFSGLFFVWLAGAIMANPQSYLKFRLRSYTPPGERENPPGKVRIAVGLYVLSDLLTIYLLARGYGQEPSLWAVMVAHIVFWPGLVRRRLMSSARRAQARRKLEALSDRNLFLTALGSLALGVTVFAFYYNL